MTTLDTLTVRVAALEASASRAPLLADEIARLQSEYAQSLKDAETVARLRALLDGEQPHLEPLEEVEEAPQLEGQPAPVAVTDQLAEAPGERGQTRREQVLAYIEAHPWQTAMEITAGTELPKGTVSGQLSVLKASGHVIQHEGRYALENAHAPRPIKIKPEKPARDPNVRILDHFADGVELSAGEAADLIGCTPREIRDLHRAGLLIAARDTTGQTIFSRPARQEHSA